MNRLIIDKENWAELFHGTPDGDEKERKALEQCVVDTIPVVTLYIHTLYTIRRIEDKIPHPKLFTPVLETLNGLVRCDPKNKVTGSQHAGTGAD